MDTTTGIAFNVPANTGLPGAIEIDVTALAIDAVLYRSNILALISRLDTELIPTDNFSNFGLSSELVLNTQQQYGVVI